MRAIVHTVVVLLLGMGLSGSLVACSSFTPEEPPVADSTFIEVLSELHLAAARARMYEDTTLTALQDSIFAHYNIPRARFERALEYFSEHPSKYAPMYEAMRDSLDNERLQLRGSIPQQKTP